MAGATEKSGRAPTGDEVIREAAMLAADYCRLQLGRIAEDDPDRDRVESIALRGEA
jgi:hypothetical protein